MGEDSSAARQTWIASVESALAAAKHVYAGLPMKERHRAFTRTVQKNGKKKQQNENKSNISSIDNKFIKMKKQNSLSSSTSSLMRQYRASSVLNNSVPSMTNYFHKKNSSPVNIQNH